jgi:hypothetical protein
MLYVQLIKQQLVVQDIQADTTFVIREQQPQLQLQ